jgi:TRAP-type mannitol/chloroaromatic compound transport system permease small subunit
MELLVRALLYTVVMFCIMVVYTGQQHATAASTLGDAGRKTGKFVAWTVVLVLVMEVCFWLFIE